MLGYLSVDIICSEKLPVFLELLPQKTNRFSEQVMSKDKIPKHVFVPNGGYRVYVPSNIICNMCGFKNWGIFSHVMCLDQSCTSKNI